MIDRCLGGSKAGSMRSARRGVKHIRRIYFMFWMMLLEVSLIFFSMFDIASMICEYCDCSICNFICMDWLMSFRLSRDSFAVVCACRSWPYVGIGSIETNRMAGLRSEAFNLRNLLGNGPTFGGSAHFLCLLIRVGRHISSDLIQ